MHKLGYKTQWQGIRQLTTSGKMITAITFNKIKYLITDKNQQLQIITQVCFCTLYLIKFQRQR